MNARAIRSYRIVSVESAPPRQLLEELLRRAIADCERARERILAGDDRGKGEQIGHAIAIVGELIAALDHGAAPELAARLAALYDFVIARLGHANVTRDPVAAGQAAGVLRTLAAGFAHVAGTP